MGRRTPAVDYLSIALQAFGGQMQYCSAADDRTAARHDDGRVPQQTLNEVFPYVLLRLIVYRRHGIVEQVYISLTVDRACEREALPLTAR
jgi:hypothetical protein